MEFGLFNVLQIAGAVAMFIYGMKLMSDGIQKAAGSQFRNVLSNITSNKWVGFISGFLITGLIQSSSATTVMTVSFVNAGLLSVAESVSLIMGANVGTTVTGWLVSLFGFRISLSEYAVPLFAVGVPMLFYTKRKIKYWGEFLLGFSLIFISLTFLRDAVPVFNENTLLFDWLKNFTQHGLLSRLFFVLVGIIITVLVQSSSVAMAITLTMCAQGWLPVEIAASLILGENIGTTSTALFASLFANREARITARIHCLFNIIGSLWMVILIPWFLPLLSDAMHFLFGTQDIYTNNTDMTIGLSAFHTAFNLLNSLLLMYFPKWLIGLASLGLKKDGDESGSTKEDFKIKILNNSGNMPEMATIQLQQEIRNFGELIQNMAACFKNIVNTTDVKKQQKLIKKIIQYEKITDTLETDITEYITTLSSQEVTPETSLIFRNVLNISNELERMADIYYQLALTFQKKTEENVYFLPEQREKINILSDLLDGAIRIMNENLASVDYKNVKKYYAQKTEKLINQQRDRMRSEHASKLGLPDYNLKSAMVYSNVFLSLERIGDHVIQVTETLAGQT